MALHLDLEQIPWASEDEVNMMQKVFNKFDKDGGGSIDINELGQALRNMGKDPTENELKTMLKDADKARHFSNSCATCRLRLRTSSLLLSGFTCCRITMAA